MSQIVYTQAANEDLARIQNFLLVVAPEKVAEVVSLIFDKLNVLSTMPLLGVSVDCDAMPELRKFLIPYGKSGYIALYKYDKQSNMVLIESIRHTRELEPKFLRFK